MIIQSKRVWVNNYFMAVQLEVVDGKINAIYPYGLKEVDVDYGKDRILPGFIDLHCHGAYGVDTNDGIPDDIEKWAKELVKEGVTTFLPTTVTQSEEVLTRACKGIYEYKKTPRAGAQVYGIHLEGPYISVKHKGAQPEQFIVKPDIEQFKRYQSVCDNLIKYVTMAPEEDDEYAFTRYASSHGVVVSMGHSSASYDEANMGAANGAKSTTHMYNGMSGLHHRNPGVVGAAMHNHDLYAEMICDTNHVVAEAMYDFIMAKGKDHVIMISDSLRCKGMPQGYYDLGGQDVEIRANGACYIVGTNTLAGSSMKFTDGLRNLIEVVQVPVDYAVRMSSTNPAECLGIADRKGRILAGLDADLVVLDDDYNVKQTYILGEAQL